MAGTAEVTGADAKVGEVNLTEAQRAEVTRLVERAIEGFLALKEYIVEVFKARQSFYERLMLLNAGTLTLLFTAIGALVTTSHSSQLHIRDGFHLVNGCWLLIASIILCLLHNWINISTMIQWQQYAILAHLGLEMSRLEEIGKRLLDPSLSLPSVQGFASRGSKAQKFGTYAENICRVIGPLAQILTVCAYFQFVLSFQTTVMTLLN